MPIISYEELLCKQAMLLSTTSFSSSFVKVSFVRLIRSYEKARFYLKRMNRFLRIVTNLEGTTIFCGVCKRDCYVAYISCNCNADPICVFHDREVMSKCDCGRDCILSLRGDLPEMEAVATKFEQEERLLERKKMKHGYLSSNKGCCREENRLALQQETTAADHKGKMCRRMRKCCKKRVVREDEENVCKIWENAGK